MYYTMVTKGQAFEGYVVVRPLAFERSPLRTIERWPVSQKIEVVSDEKEVNMGDPQSWSYKRGGLS